MNRINSKYWWAEVSQRISTEVNHFFSGIVITGSPGSITISLEALV